MFYMKLISWNVNGIRAILKKGFVDFIKKESPDVLCLQETKAQENQVGELLSQYRYRYWNSAKKRGYSGTAVFSKIKPISINYGMQLSEHDNEGRLITLEFKNFYLVNVYTPNAQPGLGRLGYKQKWDADFLKYLKRLEKKKPVVFCGDLNVAHKEIDIARPKDNRRNPGFTDEERADFDKIIKSGFIDTFREFNKKPEQYSWWTYRFNARKKNIGWRIDYFCISKKLQPILKNAFILSKVFGSDHCPVGIILK